MQDHYSLLYREEEREMFPTLKVMPIQSRLPGVLAQLIQKHFGVTSIPWSPLARGKLVRPLVEQKSTKRAGADR